MAEFIGVEIAVIVVTASIVLAGILIGIGRAASNKKIEMFGLEELVQSVINAAIIGSFAAIIELVGTISSSIVIDSCTTGNILNQFSCSLGNINSSLFFLFQELVKTMNIVGYYQSLSLDFGSFGVSPFVNLASVSNLLSMQLLVINSTMMLGELNSQIAAFIGQNALGLLFPLGLILRTVFATRKLGGFLIALAIGLFIFYPTFVLIFPSPVSAINTSILEMENFTNNSYYATIPIVDLNDNYALAGKLDLMSGRCKYSDSLFFVNGSMQNVSTQAVNGTTYNITINENGTECDLVLYSENYTYLQPDFTNDLTVISQKNNNAISQSILYTVVAPLFSLIITIIFVRELSGILGSEIGLKSFASI